MDYLKFKVLYSTKKSKYFLADVYPLSDEQKHYFAKINMLGGIPRKWVHVFIAKRNLLEISKIHAASFTFTNHF